jgi:hypothetical protein
MVKQELTKKQLGEVYAIATIRLHDIATELYEALFLNDGSPRVDGGNLSNLMLGVRMEMNQELDLINEALNQYNEFKLNDKSSQEEILFKNRADS